MKELLKKVRKLEIKTRLMVDATFGGEYHSAFKGQGLEFDEVRPYQYGDDIRTIDWNVTAKYDQVFIKLFKEEREQTLFVCFDISGSEDFGPEDENKLMIGTEISAIMAFSALKNSDKIGLLTFTDQKERYFTPKKGKSHVLSLIRGLLLHKSEHKQTNITNALDFTRKVLKKRAIVIVISDFIDDNYEQSVRQLARKHDVILIRLYHPNEIIKESAGIVPVKDAESGMIRWINSSSTLYRRQLEENFLGIEAKLQALANRTNIDLISINTEEDYIKELEKFFKGRTARRKHGR